MWSYINQIKLNMVTTNKFFIWWYMITYVTNKSISDHICSICDNFWSYHIHIKIWSWFKKFICVKIWSLKIFTVFIYDHICDLCLYIWSHMWLMFSYMITYLTCVFLYDQMIRYTTYIFINDHICNSNVWMYYHIITYAYWIDIEVTYEHI